MEDMNGNSFDEKRRDAEQERIAAAKTLADFMSKAGHQEIARKLRSGQDVNIHEIAVCIRNTDDKGLRKAMNQSVERYAEAYSDQLEYDVKSDIMGDLMREIEYQDIELSD